MASDSLQSRRVCAAMGALPIAEIHACWLLLLCTGQIAFAAVVPSSDLEILLKIKEEIYATAANNGRLEFWNSTSAGRMCEWPGVKCLLSSSNISAVSLSFQGLQGPVPELLGSLSFLEDLQLDDNAFTGQIPASLFQATGLKTLNLGYNALSGDVPANISNLQALATLDLRRNRLSGGLQPLAGLNPATLQFLYLDANNFTGDLSPLAKFTALSRMSVMQNQMTGQLDALADLRNLSALYLSNNKLNGSLLPLAGMTELESLDLGFNQLSGDIGAILSSDKLAYLRLNSNNLSGELPSVLGQTINLRVVNLSSNQFSGTIPPKICSGQTAILELSDNLLTGAMPDALFSSDCLAIIEMRLGGNRLTGNLSSNVVVRNSQLRMLSLARNNLSGGIPGTFGGLLPVVETLDLSYNSLQGDLPETSFVYMDKLQSLNLSHNHVSGAVPQQLAILANNFSLRSLDLSYNSFAGLLPPFPLDDSHNYSFVPGNLGLCSSNSSTQLPPSCPPLPPPPPPIYLVNPPTAQQKEKSASNTTALAAGVGASIAFLLLISACALLVVRQRRLKRYAKLDQPDEDLAAAMKGKKVIPMPVSMLRQATDDFSDSNKIGEGGFGKVYKGTLPDGRIVAIKKSNGHETEESKRQFLNEVRILSQVNYRGLVLLVGCCLTPGLAALVFEFVSQGTLAEHLRGNRRGRPGLSWEKRLKIAVQAADALAYLHSQANPPVFHRDVKSANILLDDNLDAKVADFGISKVVELADTHASTRNIQGTAGYIDPEYCRSYQLTAKSDVYSFGVVLLEILTGQSPLDVGRGPGSSNLVEMASEMMRKDELHLTLDPALMDSFEDHGRTSMLAVARLALACSSRRSSDRPNMTQVLSELQLQLRSYQEATVAGSAGSNFADPGTGSYFADPGTGSYFANYSAPQSSDSLGSLNPATNFSSSSILTLDKVPEVFTGIGMQGR